MHNSGMKSLSNLDKYDKWSKPTCLMRRRCLVVLDQWFLCGTSSAEINAKTWIQSGYLIIAMVTIDSIHLLITFKLRNKFNEKKEKIHVVSVNLNMSDMYQRLGWSERWQTWYYLSANWIELNYCRIYLAIRSWKIGTTMAKWEYTLLRQRQL